MRELGRLCIRLQSLALPIHGWVAAVNHLCSALGNARGAVLLSTSRQGTCLLPIIPVMMLLGQYGVASAQAVADVLTLVLAIPIILRVLKQVKQAQQEAQDGAM